MAESTDPILLVGHGMCSSSAADGLAGWAARERIALWELPIPAFQLHPATASGRPAPPQVAERLAELDDLEALFERVAAELAEGRPVLGLAVSPELASTRSGRAWLDRVRGIAAGIAQLSITVWPLGVGELPAFEAAEVRSAS
ncbi:MAG: hypothetical protein QM711_17770 [Micropruina sp.]|uniref:hypothetical protein n=1 Tax=Micropruina sp. TaxID=2737536 RepID=UPI0039E577CB